MSETQRPADSGTFVTPIVRLAVERRVTMGMIVLGVLVLGWMSLTRLPLEFLPTFSSSSISVRASYRSSSPEEVERLIVRPLEEVLGTINGIETMSASASASEGSVRLTFVDGTDMDLAAVEVRDRVDRVRHLLPADLDRIRLRRFQSTDIPVLRFHMSARWSRERLFDFAENVLQRRLERLPGVAQVDIRGALSPEVRIDLDPARLAAHGVSVRELSSQLRQENRNVSAGDIREGSKELMVRAIGEFRSVDEVRRMPLGPDGLRLADVADVSYGFPEQTNFSFLNGVEALTVRVNKTSTANLLHVVDGLKAELRALQQLPEAEGLQVRIYADASTDVRQGLGQLRQAGLFGGALAILAVFLFLRRVRTTLLVAVAIPVSVVATFVLMYFLRQASLSDITLNVVSLAGLMLALGMLVDNSIVVIESIYRHRNELGEDAHTAALAGTSEVALPILASTATTLCVFLPLIFMSQGGWMQTYLKNIATTVSIVIAASLLVALTVVPLVAAGLLRHEPVRGRRQGGLTRAYVAALGFTLRHRGVFVILIVLMLVGSVRLFSSVDRAFTTHGEQRQVTLYVDTPRQYSLEQTRELYEQLYALLDGHREQLAIADITYSFDRGTGRSRGGWSRSRRFELFLLDEKESPVSVAQVRDTLRELLPVKAGVGLRIGRGRRHDRSTGVQLEISGDDPAVLALLAGRVAEELNGMGSFKDVDTSLESGDQEIQIRVRRDRIEQTGLSTQAVAQTVSSALTSRPVSKFKTSDREVDLVLQYREDARETLDQLKNVSLHAGGVAYPLGALADFSLVDGPRSIERENHMSKVTVSANTEGAGASFMAMGMLSQLMGSFAMPPGYEWSFGRWNRMQQQDQVLGSFALIFALALIYMLMAALFESFSQPFTIMLSVPFALLGVAVVMKLSKQPLDTMATLGLIILFGVVVNNAIVLLDRINQLRRSGMDRTQAILEGGRHRLRPILITAVTTIVGLSPMVAPILLPQWFGPLEGRAGTWAPIGLVIIGGLTTSTFLTLMIIPTVYSLIDDLALFLRRVVWSVWAQPRSGESA